MQPINHPKSLMEVTADQIRNAIISGELALGSKLSEQRLADTLGVSRSPVRDALAALQTEGLVNISPKRGSFVFTPDLRDVDELCEYRAVLETAALKLGMRNAPEALFKGLEDAVGVMQKALDASDTHQYSIGDMRFHKAILDSCGNRSIAKAYNSAISPMKALRTHLFTIMDESGERSMREHIEILEACRGGDLERAATYLEDHVGHLGEAFRVKLDQEAASKSVA